MRILETVAQLGNTESRGQHIPVSQTGEIYSGGVEMRTLMKIPLSTRAPHLSPDGAVVLIPKLQVASELKKAIVQDLNVAQNVSAGTKLNHGGTTKRSMDFANV